MADDLFDRLSRALDVDDQIDEVGLVFPSQDSTVDGVIAAFTISAHKLAISVSAVASLYATGMRRFYAQQDVSAVTRVLLLLNGDHLSAWNARRRLLISGAVSVRDELRLNALVLTRHPKSAEAWAYRRAALKRYDKPFADFLDDEILLCERCAESYRRNYYAWRHRLWIIQTMNREQLNAESARMTIWTNTHISDHSGFHHAAAVLSALIQADDDAAAAARILSALTQLTSLQSFYGAHESMWMYRRALIHLHITLAIARARRNDESANIDIQAEVDGAIDALRAEFSFITIAASADDDADGSDNAVNRQFALRHRVFVVECVLRCCYGHALRTRNDSDIVPALMAALSPQHKKLYRNALKDAAYQGTQIEERTRMLSDE